MARGQARMWLMVFLGALVYLTNYTDKVVMGTMGSHILRAYHFSKIDLGVVFSAFGLTYTFLQVPIARWSEVKGHRIGVAAMTAWYGLFTVLSGFFASNLGGLAVVRGLTGLGESASMPAVTGALTRWVPPRLRGLSQGFMHAFTRVGAAITLPLSVFALLQFGITGPFWVFGVLTFLVGVLWFAIFRNSPEQAPRASRLNPLNWRILLQDRSVWALSLADFCYFYTLTIYLTWFPTFLVAHRHFTLLKVGLVGGLPFLGGAIGGMVGGRLSDYLGARTGRIELWRRIIPFIGMLGSVALVLPAAFATNETVAITLFTLSFFFLDATISVFWAIAMDIGGDNAGTVAGLMNTCANIGGLLSPLVFGILVQETGSWTLPFVVSSVLMVIGAFLVWGIRIQGGPPLTFSVPNPKEESV